MYELSDFYTLKTNNKFGNTSRFTKPDGTPCATDGTDFNAEGDIIYDNFQGIELYYDAVGVALWDVTIDRYLTTGYYILPTTIMEQLIDWENAVSPKMNNVISVSSNQWTSTTSSTSSSRANYYLRSQPIIDRALKTAQAGRQIQYKLIP